MLREEAERAAVGSQRGGGADDAAAPFGGWDGVQDIEGVVAPAEDSTGSRDAEPVQA
jgi:hypothetical protein